jgi:NAD(P)H-dependent FMN reductase
MKNIVAFSGSNSSKSINQQLIHIAAKMVVGANVEIVNIRDYPAVVYGQDEEAKNGFPASMLAFHKIMQMADGFIISSPEHNGFMPTAFKNTIDWISRMGGKTFNDKPTVFLSTSPGPRGGAAVMTQLLNVMPYQGAKVIGGHSVGSFNDKVKDGQLIDLDDKGKIENLVNQLVTAL